jgi:cyclic-di-AMP phosphodiesterase PgpH
LLFVAIVGYHEAIISTFGMAILAGFMANLSLEVTTLVATGGLMGALTLRRTERLNAFFVSGAVVGFVNAAIVATFKLMTPNTLTNTELAGLIVTALLSGLVLVPATAIASMFLVTAIFNLPTALKLLDLAQPSKPLLQRLLREAPGTYQHSLQVANLAEQAASKIGADSQLTHVAALYHDIGKMGNPLFFTENQQDPSMNPHDTLNDPYRSAAIIIEHITEGDEMAKQYHLPRRLRDFILEHHGTTQVYVFYQRAINQADGDVMAVDVNDFTYPGPKPRSRETAILMLADSCEATVRSVKPQSRQEIADLVDKIIDDKRKAKQLQDSNLTLTELDAIRNIFVDILQSMFHPRINYLEAAKKTSTQNMAKASTLTTPAPKVERKTPTRMDKVETPEVIIPKRTTEIPTLRASKTMVEMTDEEPMTEVPRLPRADELKSGNGKSPAPHPDEEQIE